jgi:hypothetical protein
MRVFRVRSISAQLACWTSSIRAEKISVFGTTSVHFTSASAFSEAFSVKALR